MAKVKYDKEITPWGMFVSFMYMVTVFAKPDSSKSTTPDLLGTSTHYSNDATYFEVACFGFVIVDVWLFHHRPDLRERIGDAFRHDLVSLFSTALGMDNIEDLLYQRLDKYGELVRSGDGLPSRLKYLAQFIAKTRDNRMPESVTQVFETIEIMDATERCGMEIALKAWATHMVPAIFKMLDGATNLLTEPSIPAHAQGTEWERLNNEATSLSLRALLYKGHGQHEQAEPLFKRSLAIREEILGPDHPDVAMSLDSLARLYCTQGQYAQAEPLFKRSLAIREKALGLDHLDVAMTLESMVILYRKTGRENVAEALEKRVDAILAIKR